MKKTQRTPRASTRTTKGAKPGQKTSAAAAGSKRGGKAAAPRFPVRGATGDRAAAKGARGGRSPARPNDRGGVTATTPDVATPARRDVSDIQALAVAAMDAALDKKALAPVLIDVSAMASYTDFIGIVSGRSDRQVDAIADSITQAMKARGRRVLGQEGGGSGRWTLLDFGAFVVHVFYHPVREFYDLESLWIDAPRVKLDVPPEATMSQPDALYGAL